MASDKQGRYIDTTKVKSVRYRYIYIYIYIHNKNLITELLIIRNGLPDRPDYRQLTDRNGKFRLCYYCRMTALKNPIVSCDFCPLYWHLDCLNPPLAIPPNPAKKWRCPNHIENIIVSYLYKLFIFVWSLIKINLHRRRQGSPRMRHK